ncbi:endogenous retrovirus group K member 7 Pro protein-like [Myotis myotis]|uniref:endogenous retrovirus group K member 7 Pro protein-like n=1 Tax=Myotis myotis TaxID=51298 RepID=UPI0017495D75|nr:endogenous retrovirus group K member 7 Pro protein-like [Myotis myotis]
MLVFSQEFWPPDWSMVEATGSITGVGVPDDTQHSAAVLRCQDEEGQTGWFQPYIVSGIAVNLWGRDVLEGLQAFIITKKGQQLIPQMGYQACQGLGKDNQGIKEPIQAKKTQEDKD